MTSRAAWWRAWPTAALRTRRSRLSRSSTIETRRQVFSWWVSAVFAGLGVVGGWWAWQSWTPGAVEPPPGILVPESPRQWEEGARVAPIHHGEFLLLPRAGFSLRARVLSRRDYRGDALSRLMPTDLALGWGRMSDSSVLRSLDIRQAARAYTWAPGPWHAGQLPIARAEIESSSANMHLIPATAAVAAVLASLRVGEVLQLEGRLVDVEGAGRLRWKTSLSRDDSGPGACEIVDVQALIVE